MSECNHEWIGGSKQPEYCEHCGADKPSTPKVEDKTWLRNIIERETNLSMESVDDLTNAILSDGFTRKENNDRV